MARRFKRKESVAKGVRRIARERIQRALSRLEDENHDPLKRIHDVRRDIKRLRALLRLMRPCIGQKAFRREIAALRQTAALLAGVRDANVKVQTIESLTRHYHGQLGNDPFPKVRKALRSHFNTQRDQLFKDNLLQQVAASLRKIERRIDTWRVKDRGWSAIGPGLLSNYRCGRREYQRLKKHPSAHGFHEWRKRVKDLAYQLRLLRRSWPEIIRANIRAADKLGEHLGEDHDTAVLDDTLCELESVRNADEIEELRMLIDQRQRELRACAVVLGARIYAEKPAQFCSRLHAWWKQWRRRDPKLSDSSILRPRPRQIAVSA